MSGQVSNIGWQSTISFQSNDKQDVFQVQEVSDNSVRPSDESLMGVEDSQFESDHAWVTGNVPKLIPVNVDGDTTVIHAWLKADSFDRKFTLRIYVEFEEAETVVSSSVASESKCEQPIEIFL